jgi:Family of unknown function (DUF6221)
MDDLSTWLLAQIEADEELARKATPGPWTVERSGSSGGAWVEPNVAGYIDVEMSYGEALGTLLNAENADHIAAWDPARVLAECEAKRKLIDRYKRAVAAAPSAVSSYVRGQDYGYREACLDAIQDEAAVYAAMGRPGYRKEWAPL